MRVVFYCRPQWQGDVLAFLVCLGVIASFAHAEAVGSRQRFTPGHRRSEARSKLRYADKTPLQSFGRYRHYAEAEVVLDVSRTLDRVRSLPRVPGSGVEILEGGKRVQGQWPASVVADLIEEGAEVVVLRDYMLSSKSGAGGGAVDEGPLSDSSGAACSGPHGFWRNDADLAISEGDWACSAIQVDDLPANAVISCLDVHYKIDHSYAGDVVVELTDQNDTIQYTLWNERGGADRDIEQAVVGITAFAGRPANQTLLLWAADVYAEHTGFIDSWSVTVYYEEAAELTGADVCSGAVVVQDGVPYQNSNVGATGSYATWCGEYDTRDVWHKFTPTQTGLVTVTVAGGRDFDPTLAVFDRCGGQELACCDDTCDSVDSEITMRLIQGTVYYIRVAGHNRTTGSYTLTVQQHARDLPDEPDVPSPALGDTDVTTSAKLSWNNWAAIADWSRAERGRVTSDKTDGLAPMIIYGDDDRREEYEVTDAQFLGLGDATVALVNWSDLENNGNGTYTLPSETFAWWYSYSDPIETGNPLCPDEPFRDQPAVAFCSGVLVAPDLIATAGHCVTCSDVTDTAVVFGFVMYDAFTPALTIDADQVYRGAEVLATQDGYPDWSLIRLQREVTDHAPVSVRTSGRPGEGQELLIVGHPYGIPRKYDAGGTLQSNTAEGFFEANFDAYPGNSGSGVFDSDSRQVEGLLAAGFESFEEDATNECDRSRVCPDAGCPGLEYISRATAFGAVVPTFDVYFGTDSDDLPLISAYSPVPWYDPGRLQGDTIYFWQVTARNAFGQVDGPLWWFRTASTPNYGPVYRFWSSRYARHFYTISQIERDKLINSYSNVWTYEGTAYYAFVTDATAGTSPVYRFWSDRNNSHFYTMNESERDKLINQYADVWAYEGPAFYAHAQGQQPAGTAPVYRFWSDAKNTHFYTISETEKNKVITQYSDIYTYEGIAWYAYE